ncbi:hypothetical protein FRC01_013786 [Tulasnella sp. 417]|nr:hypothetical protein FRC01_013786 [Tulasnella sp. 417]
MAPLHPIPAATTPSRRRRSTTAQPHSAFPVPATPSRRRTELRSRNTVKSNGPQFASASHSRAGHSTSNTTPIFWRTYPTSKASQSKRSIDPQLQKELEDHIVEVETDAFIRAVLYNNDEEAMEEGRRRADEYLDAVVEDPSHHEGRAGGDPTDSSPQPTTPTTSHSTDSTPDRRSPISDGPSDQKPPLPTESSRESEMYAQYVAHLNSVSRFFRSEIEDVDHAWPPAQPPTFPPASPIASPPLKRVFRDTHGEGRDFSRYTFGQGGLKPDICLLIESPDKPDESQAESQGEPEESEEPEDQPEESEEPEDQPEESEESEDEPEESEDELEVSEYDPEESKKSKGKPRPHWKDVLVPIELKKEPRADTEVFVQVAQYARSVMLEQFDRNFVITVLITGTMCRVFHWDVVKAQVTHSFPTHSPLFIQVMGRLATMTPSELGYDTHFSNAGRVRSTEIEHIKTHLTIHLSKPRAFFDHDATSSTRCSDNGPSLVVDLQNMQFESKGLLFNRATRVWRAVAVNSPPPGVECPWSQGNTYIVKQNWADDRRPNEGFLHTKAQEVNVVPQLVGMEERQFTSSFRARFQDEHLLRVQPVGKAKRSGRSARRTRSIPRGNAAGQQVASNVGAGDKDANCASGRSLERVLLRFVFDREGRSLSETKDSVELLQATVQWIDGLIELDKRGIIHRDISYGNLLLPLSRDGEGQASIIDFGLSHLKDSDILTQLLEGRSPKGYILESSQPHDHVTGTLPFVAHDLLAAFSDKEECEHELHHDIESVFWVLLFICLKEHQESDDKFDAILQVLTSHDPHHVKIQKWAVLMPRKVAGSMKGIGGHKFTELEDFFEGFIRIWQAPSGVGLASDVRDLASTKLQTISNKRKDPDTPDPDVSAPATKKAKHPKAP